MLMKLPLMHELRTINNKVNIIEALKAPLYNFNLTKVFILSMFLDSLS